MSASLALRSGCNPHQSPARAFVAEAPFPLAVLNGEPGFINLLDALGSWQLVRDLAATDAPVAASFKHVNPAGAATATVLDDIDRRAAHLDADLEVSPVASAYVRARGGDRLSSYGDWVAVTDPVDAPLGRVLAGEVSDGIIAPAYTTEALRLLRGKRQGRYCVLRIDPDWQPQTVETRTVFGISVQQPTNRIVPTPEHLTNFMTSSRTLPEEARRDLLVGLVAVKHAVSNAVAVCYDGQVIGLAAGQQSRIDATRLACDKADRWWLRRHPAVLDLPLQPGLSRKQRDNAVDAYLHGQAQHMPGLFTTVPAALSKADRRRWLDAQPAVVLVSDAAIPFRDNIDRAAASRVAWVAQTGGSTRDAEVIDAADQHDIAMVATGIRLFTH